MAYPQSIEVSKGIEKSKMEKLNFKKSNP